MMPRVSSSVGEGRDGQEFGGLSECKAGRPGYHPQRYLLDRYRPEQSKTSLPKTSLPEVTAEMIKLRIIVFAIVLLAMGGTLVSLNGCGGTRGGAHHPPPPAREQPPGGCLPRNP